MVQKVQKAEVKCAKIGEQSLLLFIFIVACVVQGWSQKPMVALTADHKEIGLDERVTITVTSNMEGSVKIDFPQEFAVEYGIMQGMEQKMDPSGKIKTFYYVQQNGVFRKEGSYSFYAVVTYKNKAYKSNKLTISVETKQNETFQTNVDSDAPIFGIIQLEKASIYEGESVLVKAKVYSKVFVSDIEAYEPFKMDKNPETHDFQNQRPVLGQTKINGRDALILEYGKQLVFPSSIGKCKIQPFEMSVRCQGSVFQKTVRFRSSGAFVVVKPLPEGAPKDFIGGVGEFKIAQKTGSTSLKKGDVFTLQLVVSGKGNLHNTNTPQLKLPKGCKIYGDPERKETIDFTEEGAEGSITYLYNIQAMQSGEFMVHSPSISYFDPKQEKYITVKTKQFELQVDGGNQPLVSAQRTIEKQANTSINEEKVIAAKPKTNRRSIALIVGIAAPISALSLLLLVRRRRKSANGELVEAKNECFFIAPEKIDFWSESVSAVNDQNQFAILLPKAIIQELENRLKCPCTSRDKAFTILKDKHPEHANNLREIIDLCDHFRYGFSSIDLNTRDLLNKTELILTKIK